MGEIAVLSQISSFLSKDKENKGKSLFSYRVFHNVLHWGQTVTHGEKFG